MGQGELKPGSKWLEGDGGLASPECVGQSMEGSGKKSSTKSVRAI